MDKSINELTKAVTSLDIQGSKTLETKEIAPSDSFLSNMPITSAHTASGTAYTAQNNLQLADVSRVKDEHDLLEIDWNYKKTTSKPFFIDSGAWSSSATAGTNLIKFNFPTDYFTGNHVLNTVGQTFTSFRGDLHFVVSTQGTPLSSGSLIVYAIHFQDVVSTNYDRFFRQHVILDISDNSSTADFVLPFRWNRNGVDPFATIATIYLDVLAPLGGIASVNYTITCFLENQEFKFLRPIETSSPVLLRRTQGLFNFTTVNNNLSQVENATLPTNIKGDKLDAHLGMMDDVPINLNGSPITIRYPSLNNSNNPHPIERLSLVAGSQQVSDRSMFNSQIDEMSLDHIFKKREHYFATYSISTSATVGQQIFNIPVCPAPTVFATSSSIPYGISPLEGISQYFKYWRGGLKMKIRFFMNRFQSMKFYLALFYKAVTPTTFVDWSSSHGVIIDIGGDKREVEIEIPYNSETPWLVVPHGPIDITAPFGYDWTVYDMIMGQLAMYAMTPLISPGGSPTTITAIVTLSGADDFELANMMTTGVMTHAESILMSAKSTRTPDYNTDNVVSLKQLLKRWNFVKSYETIVTGNTAAFLINPATGFNNTTSGSTNLYTSGGTNVYNYGGGSLMSAIDIFSGYRGSMKVRFEMQAFSADGKNPFVPFCYYINPDLISVMDAATFDAFANSVAETLDAWYVGTNATLAPYEVLPINNVGSQVDGSVVYEMDVPYQRNTKYKIINAIGSNNAYSEYGFILVGYYLIGRATEETSVDVSVNLYTKLGDDGRLGIINSGTYLGHSIRGANNYNLGFYP